MSRECNMWNRHEVSICGVKYTIEQVDGGYCGKNMGKSDFAQAKIYINKDLPEDVKGNVLLHEIIHLCYRNGYLCKSDDEERVVEVLTNILYPVLKELFDAEEENNGKIS